MSAQPRKDSNPVASQVCLLLQHQDASCTIHYAHQLVTLSLKLQKGLLELLAGVLVVDIALEVGGCILLELVL